MIHLLWTVGALVVCLLVVLLAGAHRRRVSLQRWRDRLDAARKPVQPPRVDFGELEGLPAPVQRYFRRVLKPGQPLSTRIRLQHEGTFLVGEASGRWRRFTSEQHVVTRRPGFLWNARISLLPGLAVHVQDGYVAGEGILSASLLGLFTLVDLTGDATLAEGERMRFLAEAVWYPTALLPSQGVRWQAAATDSADATWIEGSHTTTLRFTFHQDGLIDQVSTEARARAVGTEFVPTPWQGRFWNYADRGGVLVPLDGEVAWLLPEGPRPYWRGHVNELRRDDEERSRKRSGIQTGIRI